MGFANGVWSNITLTIFERSSMLDVWLGFESSSVNNGHHILPKMSLCMGSCKGYFILLFPDTSKLDFAHKIQKVTVTWRCFVEYKTYSNFPMNALLRKSALIRFQAVGLSHYQESILSDGSPGIFRNFLKQLLSRKASA